MRPIPMTLAAGLVLAPLLIARPAHAQFGAVAYDFKTGHWGMSMNKPTPKAALGSALHDCGTNNCRIVIRLGPRRCGAVASAGTPKGFGASARPALDQARSAALADCKKANAGECVVKAAACNK